MKLLEGAYSLCPLQDGKVEVCVCVYVCVCAMSKRACGCVLLRGVCLFVSYVMRFLFVLFVSYVMRFLFVCSLYVYTLNPKPQCTHGGVVGAVGGNRQN